MMARRHIKIKHYLSITWYNHTTTVLWPFFRDHPGEPVPEENFWTLWCKGRLTKADTQTIRLGATPSGLTSAHLHHPPFFLQAGCPSCRPTNSVKALKATKLPDTKKKIKIYEEALQTRLYWIHIMSNIKQQCCNRETVTTFHLQQIQCVPLQVLWSQIWNLHTFVKYFKYVSNRDYFMKFS